MSWLRFEPCIIRTQVPPKPTASVGMSLECGNLKGVAATEHVTAIFIDVCVHKATIRAWPLCQLQLCVAETKDRRMAPIISRAQAWIQMRLTAMLTFPSLRWRVRYSLCLVKRIRICYVDRYNCLVEGTEQMSYCFMTYVHDVRLMLFHHEHSCLFYIVLMLFTNKAICGL